MEFQELKLHPDLERGLVDAGYVNCMPVQEQVLKSAFGGQDLYVQSQTGTGKTAAFLVVIFQRLLTEAMLNGKKAIIMVPTRELAVQVEEEAKLIGKHLPFKIGSFYGGVGYAQQTKLLRENAQILVGTPGRVLDLNQSGQMNLMDIAFLVIDEADRMFDMGFYPDLRKLIRVVPPADKRQTMLFSATLNAWVKNLAWEYTKNPFEIAIEPETVTVDEVEQVLYHVASADKMKLLLGILKREEPESAIIFCNTKRYAEIVAKRLRLNGFDCEFIMGDLPQVKRLKIIEDIKAGNLRFLVATDVAARGLDIEGLALVVNYDLPNEAENYVHRIGRTARAGRTGKAVTLASEQDVYELPAIERYIGAKLPSETATGELLAEDKSEGSRIHTDYYEERGGRTGRSRASEARGIDGRSGGRRRSRDAVRSHEPKKGRDARKDNDTRRKERGRGKPRDTQDGAADSMSAVKLSGLSLEERMAYYRQKYDKSAVASGAVKSGADEHAGKKRPAEKGGARKKAAGAEALDAVNRTEKGRRQKAAHGKTGDARPPKETAASSADGRAAPAQEAPTGAAPKKGIFSKLFGLFSKDKKDKNDK